MSRAASRELREKFLAKSTEGDSRWSNQKLISSAYEIATVVSHFYQGGYQVVSTESLGYAVFTDFASYRLVVDLSRLAVSLMTDLSQ